jgi:hypothetical protein
MTIVKTQIPDQLLQQAQHLVQTGLGCQYG